MVRATTELWESQDWVTLAAVDSAAAIGARIRELRERAGVQSQTLAVGIGVDPSAMSNIERGKRAVKSSELAAIASILGVSPIALLSGDSLLSALPVAARAASAEDSGKAVLARLTALAELNQLLADSARGLEAEPSLQQVPRVKVEEWRRSGDELARWARESLLPPTDRTALDRFAELADAIERNLGVDVMVDELPADELLGASITDRRFPFILVNRDQPTSRALFTLAHELGHVLSGDGGEVVTLDFTLEPHSASERFANVFAASFLMPPSSVQEEIDKYGKTSKAIARMVVRFGVSFESLVYRLHNLGVISASSRDQLQSRGWPAVLADLDPEERRRALSRRGTRPERRPPGILLGRTLAGYEAGVVSVRPLAALLDCDADELLQSYVRGRDSEEVWSANAAEGSDTSDEDRYSGVPA